MESKKTKGSFGITYMDCFFQPEKKEKSSYYKKGKDDSSKLIDAQRKHWLNS